MLSKLNSHPRDNKITFKEEGHEYTIEGVNEKSISVTTLIHSFFPEFNADEIIDKMMNSRNWTSSKYYGKSKEEIKAGWEKDRDEAASLGTQMHKAIEDFMNLEPEKQQVYLDDFKNQKLTCSPEFHHFMKFWTDVIATTTLKPYRTEWLVFDEVKRLSGSIDMTMVDEQGNIVILDWKRSKELKTENRYQKGLGALKHLQDCNYMHYSLQLNTYRYLLQTHYGKKVVGMFLVVLHPNNDSYQFIEVKPMDKEVKLMLDTLPRTVETKTH